MIYSRIREKGGIPGFIMNGMGEDSYASVPKKW